MSGVGGKDNFGMILTDLNMTWHGRKSSDGFLSETVRELSYRCELPDGGLALPLNEKWKVGLSKCQLLNRVTMLKAETASVIRVKKVDGRWSDPMYVSEFCSVFSGTMALVSTFKTVLESKSPDSGIAVEYLPEFDQMEIIIPDGVQLMLGENFVIAFGFVYAAPAAREMNGEKVYVFSAGSMRSIAGMCEIRHGLGGAQMGKIMLDIVESNKLVGGVWSRCLGYMMLREAPFDQVYINYTPDSIGHNFVELTSSHVYALSIRIVDENDVPVTVSVVNSKLPCLIMQLEFKKGSYWRSW